MAAISRRGRMAMALLAIYLVCFTAGVNGGVSGTGMAGGATPAMALRGGADTATAEGGAADVESYMKEQMDYWKSLSKEQQEELLSKMSPQERANAEAFVSGKPTTMTITDESLQAWKAMSKEEQDAQLATMTPEQVEAVQAAVAGTRKTISLDQEVKPEQEVKA